jgi:hypothetical protein
VLIEGVSEGFKLLHGEVYLTRVNAWSRVRR